VGWSATPRGGWQLPSKVVAEGVADMELVLVEPVATCEWLGMLLLSMIATSVPSISP
jgi:hypothetical protein